MKKFENWLIVAAVVTCIWSMFCCGEDGQAFSICMFLGSVVLKSICMSKDEELRKTQELGKAYEKTNNTK